jgi:hypothetical protein
MKKHLLGLAAIVLAISFSAFSFKPYTTTLKFVPSSVTTENIFLEASYSTNLTGVTCPSGESTPCKVASPETTPALLAEFMEDEFETDPSAGVDYIRNTIADGYKN